MFSLLQWMRTTEGTIRLSFAHFQCHVSRECSLFLFLILKKCVPVMLFSLWRVQSPNLSVSFKTSRKYVVVVKVSTFVLFRCFSSLFFGLAFCMHCRVIDSPFHCLEFHQPDLTCLYTQWHTVSKVSPHTVFLRFSWQGCHCWFVFLERENHSTVWSTFIIISPAVISRPDFLHSRRDYWVHRVEAGAGAVVSFKIIFTPVMVLNKSQSQKWKFNHLLTFQTLWLTFCRRMQKVNFFKGTQSIERCMA